MKFKYAFLLITALVFVAESSAQRQHRRRARVDSALVVKAYTDSLIKYKQKLDSIASAHDQDANTLSDGRYYRLFAPLTFYHSAAAKALGADTAATYSDKVTDAVDDALLKMYLKRPDLVKNTESALNKTGSIRNDIIDEPIKQDINIVDKAEPLPDVSIYAPTNVIVKRPNFWTFGGDGNLQLLQNYVSDNWYKGGESNYSMVANMTLTANYNNKSRVKFENKFELKLGFQTSQDDTLHKFKTNNDLIRYTGKLGLQAKNNWYYTIQLLAYTQFTQGLKSNDKKVYSDFMSPFNLNIGLGMDYAVATKNNKLKGSINLSALAFNFLYVDRKDLASGYGAIAGHRTKEDFGSQVTVDLTWTISDQIKWKSRFYGYTTYERVQMEWENTITLNIIKYISTNIFLYPRFDDGSNYDEGLGYWQFKEYCSLGFTYDF